MWQWPQFRALSFMRLFTSCAPIDFPAVGKRNMQDVSDRLWAFAIKGENVSQEDFIRASDMGVTIRPHPEIYFVAPHLTRPVGCWSLREWAHAGATVEQFFGKANSQLRSPNEGVA